MEIYQVQVQENLYATFFGFVFIEIFWFAFGFFGDGGFILITEYSNLFYDYCDVYAGILRKFLERFKNFLNLVHEKNFWIKLNWSII